MILESSYKLIKQLKLFRSLTFVWLIIIFILSFIPSDDLPNADGIPHLDKIVHFTLYAVLSCLSLISFNQNQKPATKFYIICLILTISLLIEITQGILPYGRTFSMYDMLANLSGTLCGLLIYQKISKTPFFK